MSETPEQINRWANRALENLYGGWWGLAEHQLMLIIDATGGLDQDTTAEREKLRAAMFVARQAAPAEGDVRGGE